MNVQKAVAVVGNQQRGHPDGEVTLRDLAGYKSKRSTAMCHVLGRHRLLTSAGRSGLP